MRWRWWFAALPVLVLAVVLLLRQEPAEPPAETAAPERAATAEAPVVPTPPRPARAPVDPERLLLEVIASSGEPLDDVSATLDSLDKKTHEEWDEPAEAPFARSLPAGQYRLKVEAEGYATETEVVALPAAENHLKVVLTSTWTEISGRVISQAPLSSGAVVQANELGEAFLGEDLEGAVGADGSFKIRVPKAAAYLVSIHDEQGGSAEKEVTAPATDVLLEVLRRAGVVIHLDVPAAQKAEGYIQPLPDGGSQWTVELDPLADGREVWGLPPGPALVKAYAGETTGQQLVELREGELTAVHLALAPGVTVEGRVVDPQGQPIAHAELTSGNELNETGPDGRFRFVHLDDTDQLLISAKAFPDREVHIGDGRLGDIMLGERERRHVTGRVHGAQGERITRFTVQAEEPDPALGELESASGDFAIDVPATAKELTFQAAGFYPKYLELEPEAADLDVALKARRPRLEGQVLAANGTPASAVEVGCTICQGLDHGRSVVSDQSGHFAIETGGDFKTVALVARQGTRSAVAITHGEPVVLTLAGPVELHGKVPAVSGKIEVFGYRTHRKVALAPDGSFSTTLDRGLYSFELLRPDGTSKLLLTTDDELEVRLDAPVVELVLQLPPQP